MADDDIEALLRQVESSLNPGATASSSNSSPNTSGQAPAKASKEPSTGANIGPALIAVVVGAGGVWLAITFLQGLKWIAVLVAFVATVLLWLRRD